jgi:hypothetical protein
MAQVVECQPSKHDTDFKPQDCQKKKNNENRLGMVAHLIHYTLAS